MEGRYDNPHTGVAAQAWDRGSEYAMRVVAEFSHHSAINRAEGPEKEDGMTIKLEWFTGSNGNLFVDGNGFRYCIARDGDGYTIARNGFQFASAHSLAEAKLIVRRDIG